MNEKQPSLPIATIRGKPLIHVPASLYIPPHALEILLETFIGPLDLLLYLIKNKDFDILDIPVSEIAYQYLQYIQLIKIELATEYLPTTALLAEIKSRLLLAEPCKNNSSHDPPPHIELARRLQEYQPIKQAAYKLDQLPRIGRDIFLGMAHARTTSISITPSDLALGNLTKTFRSIVQRTVVKTPHIIIKEPLSIQARMSQILHKMGSHSVIQFTKLLVDTGNERASIIITFMALLELNRQALVELVQISAFEEIEVRTREV